MTSPRSTSAPGKLATERATTIAPDALDVAAREFVASAGIVGSGDGGEVTREDVERAIRERPQPMSRTRQVIAKRLTESFTTTPHFSVTVAVDLTDLQALRDELRAASRAYTVTDFVAVAAVRALAEYPLVNARTDGRQVWLRERVDLGLAVALDSGLVVPVVRGADRLGLPELHDRIVTLVEMARKRTLPPHDLTGSTFTITNMGMLDVEQFTAIINPGEAAILAVSTATPTPAVVAGEVAIRQLMRLTLSADHRLIDGALAARFLNAVRHRLEEVRVLRAAAGEARALAVRGSTSMLAEPTGAAIRSDAQSESGRS